MKWKIITDSGSNLREIENLPENITFDIVPLVLNLDDKVFLDTAKLDTEQLIKEMDVATVTSTACPAPGEYAEKFKGAENVICFTISGEVSGSYNSAVLGRSIALEKNPEANIHIVNSKSAGGEMDLLILKAIDLIKDGKDFNEVVNGINDYHKHTYVGYMLQSVDNLVKNGRVSKIVGSLVGLLNINILGIRSEDGEIEMSDRVRGEKRALNTFVDQLVDTGFNGKALEIGHVHNKELAEKLANKMKERYPEVRVNIRPTTGLCSFYAEDKGLIVGYERD